MDEGLYLSRNGAIVRVKCHCAGMFHIRNLATGEESVAGAIVAANMLWKKLELPQLFDMLGVAVVEPKVLSRYTSVTLTYPRGEYVIKRVGAEWRVQYRTLTHDTLEDAKQWCERHYMSLVLKDIHVGLHD